MGYGAASPISADIASGDAIVVPAAQAGGRIYGFVVASTTAAVGDVVFYDNVAGSGTVLCRISVPSTGVGIATKEVIFPNGVHFTKGVFIDITDLTTGSVIVYVG